MNAPRVDGDRQRRQQAGAAVLADDTTPLVRHAWYAVATSDEVGRRLLSREVLETSIVLYRRQDGRPVVLQNRCPHRSFPLASGSLEGDSLRCGYHGLRYDAQGRCDEIPMQSRVPDGPCLRRYAAVERASFVWVWFGPAETADEALLPVPDWMSAAGWDRYQGYLQLDGGYLHMHENLLDLSHLSFLHATTFGTPEYARAPVQLEVQGEDIQVWRHVECVLPDLYAVPLGWQGERVMRSSGSRYVAPGLHVNTGILRHPALAPDAPPAEIRVAQLITPETRERTHYWFVACRNFARGRPDLDAFMCQAQLRAFSEDQFAIEQISRLRRIDGVTAVGDAHLPTDAAGLAMRRLIKKLADRESALDTGESRKET